MRCRLLRHLLIPDGRDVGPKCNSTLLTGIFRTRLAWIGIRVTSEIYFYAQTGGLPYHFRCRHRGKNEAN